MTATTSYCGAVSCWRRIEKEPQSISHAGRIQTYMPWLSVRRSIVPLFPGYCLCADRRSRLVGCTLVCRRPEHRGDRIGEPAHVPDRVISGSAVESGTD